MRLQLAAVAALVSVSVGVAADNGLKAGKVELKSVSALAFGPDGVLFIGDATAGTITAVGTGDTKSAGKDDVKIEKLGDKIGSLLGTEAANVTVNDVKVNPASGTIYLAVTRKGAGGGPIILTATRDGKLAEFKLAEVPTASVKLPNATEKNRTEAITSMAYVEGKLIVAGLSNEEFASTLRTIPFPFSEADKGSSVEMFHAAHNKTETNSPIRTFTPYKIGAADYLLAAYQCTPLVKVAVADLKPGTKVKGTTIAELGNQNRPLDMVVYTKDKKDYVLVANTKRGVMKIAADQFTTAEGITKGVSGGGTAGVKFETIKELTGVLQLDKLDDNRAVLLVLGDDKALTLKSIALP